MPTNYIDQSATVEREATIGAMILKVVFIRLIDRICY